jgi:hypothetical protein
MEAQLRALIAQYEEQEANENADQPLKEILNNIFTILSTPGVQNTLARPVNDGLRADLEHLLNEALYSDRFMDDDGFQETLSNFHGIMRNLAGGGKKKRNRKTRKSKQKSKKGRSRSKSRKH